MTFKSALLVTPFLTLLACGQNPGNLNTSSQETALISPSRQSQLIGVVDEDGKAVAGAQILIGTAANQPFADNFVVTDANGKITAPIGWTNEQPVTIQVKDYVRATYLKQTPQGQNFTVRKKIANKNIELNGLTSGYSITDYDGWIDFGVVVPAISKANFFNFDVTSFISPYNDTISVIGKDIKVPSNISLPEQSESYFISITLAKPKYRTIFKTPGNKTVFAIKGKFPLSEVVDEIRGGKDFTRLTNFFNFSGGSLREVNLQKKTTLNIPMNDIKFSKKAAIRAPQQRSDEVVMAVSLAPTKSMFYPADIKGLPPGKTISMNQVDAKSQLLSVLKKKDEMKPGKPNFDRLSASFLPMSANMTPTFLSLLDAPRVNNALNINIGNATLPQNTKPGAAYLVLSKVDQVEVTGTKVDLLDNQWEVYSPEWSRNVEVPAWPNDKLPTGNLRWEVTLTAVPEQNSLDSKELGPKWLEAASHATRSSTDF